MENNYEESLIHQLDELEKKKAWIEEQLREVRNRKQRNKNTDIIDWSGDKPKFNSVGEWVK